MNGTSREGVVLFEPVKRETGGRPVRTRHCKQGAAKKTKESLDSGKTTFLL